MQAAAHEVIHNVVTASHAMKHLADHARFLAAGDLTEAWGVGDGCRVRRTARTGPGQRATSVQGGAP
jgi:hypothetical protein